MSEGGGQTDGREHDTHPRVRQRLFRQELIWESAPEHTDVKSTEKHGIVVRGKVAAAHQRMRHCGSETDEQNHRFMRVEYNLLDHQQERGHLLKDAEEKNAPKPETEDRKRLQRAAVVIRFRKETHEHAGERNIEEIHEAAEI